jgi:uncharacterized damage-inducible protein DinB
MHYSSSPIPAADVPRADAPFVQHLVDTYASEVNKVASVWSSFRDDDLAWTPHPRSTPVAGILRHELLSGRRFFGEFLGAPEPPASAVVPSEATVRAFVDRLVELARPRLAFIAGRPQEWWLEAVPFFDVNRQRIWIFWRRVLHTAHHRTQLTVYLRLMDRPVPPTYGPTADVTWSDADPTTTVDAAARGGR